MVNPNQNDEFNMMPFGIRFLRKSDISNMVKIEREIFPAMPSGTSFGKEIKNSDRIYIVAFERKKI
jgi:hypothetical protein